MSRGTREFKNQQYSKNLIHQYEDQDYVRAAEAYELQARAEKAKRRMEARQAGYDARYERYDAYDSYDARESRSSQDYTYEDYLRAREEGRQGSGQPRQVRSHQEPPKRRQKNKKTKKKRFRPFKLLRNILILVLILAVAVAGYGLSLTDNLDHVDTEGEAFAIDTGVAEDLKDYRNIAILGSDAREGEGYDGSRTDAIIILSINRKTNHVKMISVMRDSYLKFEGADGELGLDKITHAHAFGGGVNTVEGLNRSLDLNIEEFVIFNWKAVADTVDTLGGIEIDVKKNEISDLNTWGPETGENVGKKYHKIKKTGVQTLDGTQATTYCRIRKNSGGDTGRADRYKKVMNGVLKKAATSPWKIGALADEVMPQVRTNMSKKQFATLLGRAPFFDMEKSVSWPKSYYGGLIGGVWYAVPQTLERNVRKLHKQAFEQKKYTPSATCRGISDEIIYNTGIQ